MEFSRIGGDRQFVSFTMDGGIDAAHFYYGTVVLHISLDELREVGIAIQTVT